MKVCGEMVNGKNDDENDEQYKTMMRKNGHFLFITKHAVVKLVHSDSGSSNNATIRNTVGMTLTHNSRFPRQPASQPLI